MGGDTNSHTFFNPDSDTATTHAYSDVDPDADLDPDLDPDSHCDFHPDTHSHTASDHLQR